MARVLVVGCGYVGSKLALRLRASGHHVFALRRRPIELEGVESIAADITEPSTLSLPRGRRFDVAFFTAAPDSSDEKSYRSVYVEGLRNVAGSLDDATRLIFTSSTAVYGQDDGSEVDEDSQTAPKNFRGRVLLEAESVAGMSLRLGGIYGPGRTRALDRTRAGEARYQPGRYLNLIHRDDVCGALEHLMSLPAPETVYIGTDREPVESERFYRWLAQVVGGPPPVEEPGGHGLGKRCSSERLIASGYELEYPTYRHGYGELMKT